MTRNRLRIGVGMVLTVALVVGVTLVISNSTSDCDTVRAMIAHNNEFNEHIDSAAADGVQPDVGEYQSWALQMRRLAEKVRDPALAERAHTVANLAEESVPMAEMYLEDDEVGAHYNSAPPQYIKDYSRIAGQFHEGLATLREKCPD